MKHCWIFPIRLWIPWIRFGNHWCAQVILGDSSPAEVDARMVRNAQIAQLKADIDKLTRDHQRVKNSAQRNEIFAKLHKAKKQLEELQG